MVDAHIGRMFASLTRDACAAKLRRANTAYGFVNDCAGLQRPPGAAARFGRDAGRVRWRSARRRRVLSDGARALGPVPALDAHGAALRAEFAA